ncbi:glucosamine-6-phosphate deaminase [Bacillus sp. JCM 19041]|uniref:glucosamine-6-phosphate deaminase n=1 Tax=Bacillus sp. JCM 19041 TaxID=1460637 RepID=UPI0006D23F80
MRVIQVKDYEEMSEVAANLLFQRVKEADALSLGVATGGTPEETYTRLAKKANESKQSFSHVNTYNLDEYVGLLPQHPNSYRYYMEQHLFTKIDIPKEQTHLPDGTAVDLHDECNRYDRLIKNGGGIDVQLLGIGANGHIGFNEPGTPFETGTHLVELTNETREANARYFTTKDSVPTKAITMGIATIMEAKEIVLLVSGQSKALAFAKLMDGEITEEFPASVLNKHANVIIIADKAASSMYASKHVS